MKLSLIIPAHNEEKRIGKTLKSYSDYFESIAKKQGLNYQILVVLNNTTDNTEKIVQKYALENPNITYLDILRKGKGYAIIEGFKESLKGNFDFIGFVDADMATSPGAFYNLVERIGFYDAVIAGRYLKGAKVYPKQSFRRILASRAFNMLTRALFSLPYRDTQCGAKLFKTSSLRLTLPHLRISRFAFDIDILYTMRRQKFSILEIPTTWSNIGDEKINFLSDGTWMVLAIIRLRLLNSILKDFIRIYDLIPHTIWKTTKSRKP